MAPEILDVQRIREALLGRPEPAGVRFRATDGSPPKLASVAAVLRDGEDGAEVLLIRRAEHPNDPWSGHMAFPGGRRDPEDADATATAVRETLEEVGLDLTAHAERLGRLPDLPAVGRGRPTGLTITPIVFALTQSAPELTPNHEVQEALWAGLEPIRRGRVDTTITYRHEGQDLQFPAYDVRGRTVWGLTYRMLQLLFEAVQR